MKLKNGLVKGIIRNPYAMIFLILILSIMLQLIVTPLVLSSDSFSLDIEVSPSSLAFSIKGPPNKPFSLVILDFKQNELFERTASTDSLGHYNLFLPVFEDGSYTAILRSGDESVTKDFEIKSSLIKSTTTTFTIPFVTADDYNEIESLEYVRDSNLNKIKAKIRTFNRLPTQASNIRDVYVIPEDGPVKEIRFKSLNVSNEFEIGIDDVPEDIDSPKGIEWSEIYAIDPSKLEFNFATVKAVAKGNALYKCRDWNFSEQRCYGTWKKIMNLNPGEEYYFELTAEDPGFGELNITKAEHLDENRTFVEDIYDYVKVRDNNWIGIPSGHYIRATFEKNLSSGNDITIYARSNYTNSSVKVYEENGNETIADFGVINENKKYRILLTNLTGSRDTFDLKVVGGNVEFDWIVDPVVVFFNDTFTEASDTALTSHIPDDGTGWSLAAQSAAISATVIAARDILQFSSNANDYSLWTADDSPTSSEYNVSVTVKAIDTRDDVALLLGRYVDTSNTYVVSLSGTAAECHLKVVSGGSVTTLDTPGTGVSVNDVIEFEITNSSKNVYRNGALWMSSNNDDVTSIGRGGTGCGDFAGDGSEDCRPNWDLDDFIIKEFRSDTTPPVITINSPENTSYNSLPIDINVTTNEDADWCGWNLDNSGSNTTMDNSSMTEWNGSVTSTTEGTHQLYVYCNDTKGNMGVNSTIYFTYDLTPPTYSNVQQNPSIPKYGQDVQCNSTWNDLSSVDIVVFRSNYTGSWTNYTTDDPICSNQSNIFYCNIPTTELPAGKVVGWNYWANDSLNHWNDTMTEQVFTVQKAPTEMDLLLNGTDGDENYEVGQIANITAVLNVSGFNVEIWSNFTGMTDNVSNSPGPTPLTNITNTSNFSPGDIFNITGYFEGNENYTNSSESHLIIMSTDATDPNITDVNPVDDISGFGRVVNITANVTDSSGVDTVFVNITLPDNTWEQYEMTNSTPDIYEYNYVPWQTGSYYYYIWANDTYGNSKTYHPYFYVNGSAVIGACTVKNKYGPNEDVNLTPAQNWTSNNLESGTIEKKAGGIEYYYNESESESTWSTDTSWQDKLVLNITPTGGNYLILASAELRGTDSANDVRARLTVDGTDYGNTSTEPDETGATDWHTHFATHRIANLDGSEHMLRIQFSKDGGGGTVGIKNARIAVFEVDDYEYNETEGQVTINSNTVWGTTVTRNFTVGDAGYYLIIGSTEANPRTTRDSINERLVIDGTDQGIFEMEAEQGGTPTTDWENYLTMNITYLDPGSHTIDMQHKVDSGDAGPMYSRKSRVSAIRLNDFLNFEISASETYTTTSATSWVERHQLTFTPTTQEDYLFFVMGLLGGDASNGNAYNTFVDSRIDSAGYGYWEGGISDDNDRLTYFSMKNISLDVSSHTTDIRYYGGASASPDPGLGSVRIVGLEMPEKDTDENTSYTTYENIGSDYRNLNKIDIIIEADSYDPRGSVTKSNTKPDLELDVWNGDSWYNIGNFNLTGTYTGNGLNTTNFNFTISVTNSSILNAWKTYTNRDLRIRGINFDYYNVSQKDEIYWNRVWVKLYNNSMLINYGYTNISGYLLMQVQTNTSGSWALVETVVNDTNASTLRNVSSGKYLDLSPIWNSNPWNTNSYQTGFYRIYSAFTDDEGNVLENDDNTHINNTYEFQISVFDNINATPQTVGYGYNVTISADVLVENVDTVFVNITYPNQATTWKQMTNISNTYQYNFSDTWQWGDYSYSIWMNDTYGGNSTSSSYNFYVRTNATMSVFVVNDNYGPNEDVDLTQISSNWWNKTWSYRTLVNISADGYNRTDTPIELGLNFTDLLIEAGCNGTCTFDNNSVRVLEYNSSMHIIGERNSVFLKNSSYSATSNALGDVIWLLNGSTLSTETRYYYIYFDTTEDGPKPAPEYNYSVSYNSSKYVTIDGNTILQFDDSGQIDKAYLMGSDVDLSSGDLNYGYDKWYWSYNYWSGSTYYGASLDSWEVMLAEGPMVIINASVYVGQRYTDAILKIYKHDNNTWIMYMDDWHNDFDEDGGIADTEYFTSIYRDYSGDLEYRLSGGSITQADASYTFYNIEGEEWVDSRFYTVSPDAYISWVMKGGFDDVSWDWTLQPRDRNDGYYDRFGLSDNDLVVIPNGTEFTRDLALVVSDSSGGWEKMNATYEEINNPLNISQESPEKISDSIIWNTGSLDMKGYLIMRIQRYDGGSWVNFESPVVNDLIAPTQRTINTSNILRLDTIWNPAGWDTDLNTPGTYRVNSTLVNPSGTFLRDDLGNIISAIDEFEIITGYMELTNLTHENNYTYGVNEYETGDNLEWINVTVTNRNTTSVNASITLNVLDYSSSQVNWGPNETQYCGDLGVNETCEKKFDNQTNGYPIPLDATSGYYDFFWNVTMGSESGSTTYNNSLFFYIHHIPDSLSSTLSPEKIYQNKSSLYNFNITNPWFSKNLTDVNVTVNYPQSLGFTCNCTLVGQETQDYCYLSNITPGDWKNATFNISTNSTPAEDYSINATLSYTNIGGESHTWSEQQNQILHVRIPGQFVEIADYPVTITRGESCDLKGYVNNTLIITMNNVWLNWTLPSGWTNTTGDLDEYNETLSPASILWNNITASLVISSQLGSQEVRLDSSCQEGYTDWDIVVVTVYANTTITPSVNNSDPVQGETVKIDAYLRYDNGTGIANQNLTFNDTTTDYFIGWDLTDSSGLATVNYQLAPTETFGDHIINISYGGKGSPVYTNPSWNTTNITVHDEPSITNVTTSPITQGYGYNVTIKANVTDWDGIDEVRVYITPPDSGTSYYQMTNYTPDIYEYNYSSTWKNGQYSYYVWAIDDIGKTNQTSVYYFYISSNTTLNIKTDKDSYSPQEYVNLTSNSADWWNKSWEYRRQVNVTENNGSDVSNYTLNVSFSPNDHVNSDCSDIRVVYNKTTEVGYEVVTCSPSGTTTIEFLANLSASETSTDYYIYYGNPLAEDQSISISNYVNLDWETMHPYDSSVNSWNCTNGVCSGGTPTFDCPFTAAESTVNARAYMRVIIGDSGDSFTIADGDSSTLESWNSNFNNGNYGWTNFYDTDDFRFHFVSDPDSSVYWGVDVQQMQCTMDNPPTGNVGEEERAYSQIIDTGTTDLRGYLTMKVQRQVGESWQDVSGGLVVDNESYNVSTWEYLDLDGIWNNNPWNTDEESSGNYRVLGYLTDPQGNILKNDDNSDMLGYYNFSIAEPPSIVQIREIKIYDVTNASDKHTNTSILAGSGLNTTFDIYTGKIYRAEIIMWNNDTSESNWTIDSSDVIFHEELDSIWEINYTDDIWYANSTLNYTGGNWSSDKVEWNTSQGDMLVQVDQNVTFSYIFNITSISADQYFVHFVVNNSLFTEEDFSIYNLIVSEDLPPQLYNEIYGLTNYAVNRGDSLKAYARWDEEIKNATAEYNDTSSGLENHTISSPYTNDWTNHTLNTNTSWLLGNHSLKIYSSDLNDNWNDTLPYLTFEVWGWSSVPSSSINPSTVVQGNPVIMSCRVVSDNTSGISGYSVAFYNSTEQLGVNQTNATGWASFTFTDNSLGYENITCNITDNATMFYNASSDNQELQTLRTIETESPKYSQVTQNISVAHKGDAILYRAYWTDNVKVDYAWLSTNETVIWQNSSLASPIWIDDTDGWSDFEVTLPTTMTPGILGWRIYANDTSSNENETLVNTTEVWGWSEVSDSDLDPSIIYEGEWSIFSCKVRDLNGSAISGYNVSFYNSTHSLGINQTNSTGWAFWNYTDYSNGTDTLVCNITDYAVIMYNASANNNKTETLTTKEPGEDITPPYAIVYEINDIVAWKGDSLFIYAQWNESIGNSYTKYNDTSSQIVGYTTETIGGDNWTNHTIVTNSSWITGVHVAKINASDQAVPENWNDTLPYKNFEVWGRSKVEWTEPAGNQYRETIPLTCRVIDKDGGYGIEDYQIDFYDDDWVWINSTNTNSTGYATVTWDAQTETVGVKTLRCLINDKPSAYYNTTGADDDASSQITLMGILNVSVDYPENESSFNVGDTVNLNSTTKDENDIGVTPDTANWTNTTNYIGSGENTTWTIPTGHSIGPELITVNVTKQYYDSNENNVTIFVWGWSEVNWTYPDGGEYSQGSTIPLTCHVMNSNTSASIQNYPVEFYVENSTDSISLGNDLTNSSGYATVNWDTTGYTEGYYYPKCNITDNATLYYNASESYEDNTTVNITGVAGKLIVFLNEPPDNTIVPRYRNFTVNATVICRDANCGSVQGRARYNSSGSEPNTDISTTPGATPFYTFDSNPQNCNLNQDDNCTMIWKVNSTGSLDSYYNIDVLFSNPSNDTNNSLVRIGIVLVLNVSTGSIDWGNQDSDQQGLAAPGNPYQVGLDENSNDAAGLYIKGTDLTGSTSTPIEVSNISWCKECSGYLTSTRMNNSYQLIQSSPPSGITYDTYFWLDTPPVYYGQYTGSITIMANASW